MPDTDTGRPREPGGHDPLHAGLFRSVSRPGFTVDAEKWRRASEDGALVGQCRQRGCGGYLVCDDDPERYRAGIALEWFTARCLVCGREVASPAGRLLHRSGRHAEAPDFYAKRGDLLKKGGRS